MLSIVEQYKKNNLTSFKDSHINKINLFDNDGNERVRFTFRMRETPNYTLPEPSQGISNNIVGMYNFFNRVNTSKTTIKEKLLAKIASINLEIGVICNGSLIDFKDLILSITNALDGVVFSADNSLFRLDEANNGIFSKDGKLILDTIGNSDSEDIEVFVESKYFDIKNTDQ